MDIRAAVVREAGHFNIESLDLGEPQGEEVLVRIAATGLCHTDLAALDQHLPYPLPGILGHEGAGVVLRIGPQVRDLQPGDPVVLSFAACGRCVNCQLGRPAYCHEARQLNLATRRADGSCTHHAGSQAIAAGFFGQSSLATHALVQERNAVRVPPDLPLRSLAPLACGVQTGAGGVLHVLRPAAGSSLVVFGMGAVGLSAVMAAKAVGCTRIVAVDLHASRLDLAAELGATDRVLAGDVPADAQVQMLVPGGTDFAIDATGVPSVMGAAVASTHRTGSTLMLGMAPPGASVKLQASLLLGGRTIRSSIEGDSVPAAFIPQLIALHRAGLLPFDRLCRDYPLQALHEAIADCRSGRTVKPIIVMPDAHD
jgi:aryl-alcohol dehydrogenase